MNLLKKLDGMTFRLSCTALMVIGVTACTPDKQITETPVVAAKPKNVILFIGDGMGVSTVTAIRIYEGQLRGMSGEENTLSWEAFPRVALSKTYNTNQQVPDSAGTATAIYTGVKTKAGVLGVGPDVIRADCASTPGTELPTILELAEEQGLSTGVVTTARLTHATPGASYAHISERDWEADSEMPKEALEQGCKDVALQFVDFNKGNGIEVALGGGRRNFLPATMIDPEYAIKTGERHDGRDLTREWQAKHPDGAYVWNAEQFAAIDPAATDRLLGLFEPGHMQYDYDRTKDGSREPSLAEMTEKAIKVLSRNDKGYFLMVEGGRIDHGHHDGRAAMALTDGVALNEAVKMADSLTDDADTLIIVTADHSHTFIMAGYPTRGNPILGKVIGNDDHGNPEKTYSLMEDGKPYTTLGYQNGPGGIWPADDHHYERRDLTDVDTTDPEFVQQALLPRKSETHGGEDVAIYAKGAGAEKIGGVMEQNLIFDALKQVLPSEK
ncbi:alkaline phosphatase [Emcibacter sp.]|uniref:alkaline phosphatase n=1 Tax=Emcibacter sp. TaxID=1979954 RepID=UPI002AA709B1|nr:alkaline phosphatase [Emcibacter sp.]